MPNRAHVPDIDAKDGKPIKWWQWFIVYPTIATSFFAAIPTVTDFMKSVLWNVKRVDVSDAEAQNKLWAKNTDCIGHSRGISIKTPQSFEIAATVCPNGDILLAGRRADSDSPRQRWVPISDVLPPITPAVAQEIGLFSLIPAAMAGERRSTMSAQLEPVICQRWVSEGRLLQRVSTPNGCFDQVVNTFNGLIVSRQAAPCSPQC